METHSYQNINTVDWLDGFLIDYSQSDKFNGSSIYLHSLFGTDMILSSSIVFNESQSIELDSLVTKWNTSSYQNLIDGYKLKIWDHATTKTKFIDEFTPPIDLDFRVEINGRFEHDKILVKGDHGDYSSKVYYSMVDTTSSNKPILLDPVIRRDYTYEYHHSDRWVKKCETISWYFSDESLHPTTKDICYYFEGQKYMNYMVEKRVEIINFLKTWVEQSLGYNAYYNPSSSLYGNSFSQLDTTGKSFLADFNTSIRVFIDGGHQDQTGSFTYRLMNDTGSHVWLGDPTTPTIPNGNGTDTIAQFMVSESLFPVS